MDNTVSRRRLLSFAVLAGVVATKRTLSSSSGFFAEGREGLTEPSVGALTRPKKEEQKKRRILRAELGEAIPYRGIVEGNTWSTAWGDDDHLYLISNDTTGFNRACDSNLAVSRITGGPPPTIEGTTVNGMSAFGRAGEIHSDAASWKACGITCVDGVLYLSVSRRASSPPTSRYWALHEAWDSSIVKSTDHGKTWSTAPELGKPMFPGRIFATPVFVQYGKDYQGQKDEVFGFSLYGDYVYAVSNDGVWNNGSWMTLGRVSRGQIGRLDPEDWEFVQGYDEQDHAVWGGRVETARCIFWASGRTSMTGIHYFPGLDLLIMPQWHYVHLEDPERRWEVTRLELYQAPWPWGPWTLFHTQEFDRKGWYSPNIPSKFISEDGRRFWIFVSGNCCEDRATSYAGLYMIPVTLETEA